MNSAPQRTAPPDTEFWLDCYTWLLMTPPTRRRGARDAWWPCPWADRELFVDLGNGIWRLRDEKGDFIAAVRFSRQAGVSLS